MGQLTNLSVVSALGRKLCFDLQPGHNLNNLAKFQPLLQGFFYNIRALWLSGQYANPVFLYPCQADEHLQLRGCLNRTRRPISLPKSGEDQKIKVITSSNV